MAFEESEPKTEVIKLKFNIFGCENFRVDKKILHKMKYPDPGRIDKI